MTVSYKRPDILLSPKPGIYHNYRHPLLHTNRGDLPLVVVGEPHVGGLEIVGQEVELELGTEGGIGRI